MITEFIDGLQQFHFLQNALITAIAIGIVAGAVGCFIILRGMSLMGDAISHAVLPGVALSFILALGVILIGVAKSSTDLFHILFGNILAVQDRDMWITIGVGAAVLLVIVLLFRPLLLTSFDPVLAQSMGVRVKVYHYLLMVLLTLVSVTAMQSVGTILIVAMLITPAATAYLYTNSLWSMMLLSSGLGALASILGLFIGYSLNIAVGSCIVLTSAVFFLISFFIAPKQRKNKHALSSH